MTSRAPSLVMTGVEEMTLRPEAESPLPSADYVRIKVHSCGICGSDMHAYHGHDARRVPPLVLGHEVVGWHDDDGEVRRVAVNPLMGCGVCVTCRRGCEHLCSEREMIGMRLPGGFGPSMLIKQQNLTTLPEGLDFADAVLVEPLACSVHAVALYQRHSLRMLGESRFTILGGGAIGLLIAQVLLTEGVASLTLVEAHDARRAVLGEVLPEAQIVAPGATLPAQDGVFDAVGSGITREVASNLACPGGVVVHVGLQDAAPGLDARRLTLQEVVFVGCYCYRKPDFARALTLLARGMVRSGNWLDYRPLGEGVQAFAELHRGSPRLKIVLGL